MEEPPVISLPPNRECKHHAFKHSIILYARNVRAAAAEAEADIGYTLIPPELECSRCIMENETIFFVETNPEAARFTGRKLCAFESAARLNPDNYLVGNKEIISLF